MEENVALKPDKQKKFVKSIKGIKKLIKSNKVRKIDDDKPVLNSIKKAKRKPRKSKGLVYLSRIPHGFYEQQMTDYFKQFGRVTNVRVIRSRRTGKSKSHAFIEFADTKVGQIVAETMNNYLMGKRLLKAVYIEPSKQRIAFRKKWNAQDNPGVTMKRSMKKGYNRDKTDNEELKRSKTILKNLSKTQEKLREMGIDYSFFNPVDVPKELMKVKTEDEVLIKPKENSKTQPVKKGTKPEIKSKPGKIEKIKPKINKNTNKPKPLGEFVKIKEKESEEETDSDDGSIDFDSDEFERLLEEDDEDNLSSGSEDEGSEADDNSDSDQVIEEKPNLIKKRKSQTVSKNIPTKVVKQNKNQGRGNVIEKKTSKIEKINSKFEKKGKKGTGQIKKKK